MSNKDKGGIFIAIQSCKLSEGILNQYALELLGQEIAFKVHYWGVNPKHYDTPVHRHSFFEVCYVLRGEGLYKEMGEQYPLKKGTVFLSRPNIPHQILSESGLFLVFVAFELIHDHSKDTDINMFSRLKRTNKIIISAADDSPTSLLWRALIAYTSDDGSIDFHYTTNIAYTLILSFDSLFSQVSQRRHDKMLSNSSQTLLYQAKLYIRDNLSASLKLEHVANYLHISGRHLSRLFSNELNESFTFYIRKERVKEAARLLETTSIPIKEIADITGLGTVHNFTRVFSLIMNVSPAKYRSEYEKRRI